MEENKLTVKDIFVQITALQRQLTENSYTSLHHLDDAISNLVEGDDSENDERWEQIGNICSVFRARETTLMTMLELYEKMYSNIQNEEATRVNLIKSAFDNNMSMINESDMEPQDKFAALGYVTDKIAELVEQVIIHNEN
ncbi:MAG: hypothetical protein IKC97_07330 [Clostridia bacterium]|nr:hypothetical protein [Clostridia bacterium]